MNTAHAQASRSTAYGNYASQRQAAEPKAPPRNQILAGLTPQERAAIQPQLQLAAMPLGVSLYESCSSPSHLYFPIDCVVALLCDMEDGRSMEIAVVGNCGAVGVSLFMGDGRSTNRAVVIGAGSAYKVGGTWLRAEFARNPALQRLLLRYTQALLTQMAQSAVCNRHHSLDQQLCRLLLLMRDRLPTNEIIMTQEMMANMLGVRREGVTEAAGNLQRAGLIDYRRAHITVADRAGLEARTCECYGVVKNEYDRLLGGK
jgi:CRP-like cAMP-binding protein